jgi:hypothetical protein
VIDLVYPLKAGGSRLNDAELRWSLRSAAQHLQLPIGEVYLFGHRPEWLSGVIHVPMDDRGDKAENLKAKYRRMCDTVELSDPFLLLDDDHIFLAPTSEIPAHTRGPLAALCREYRGTAHGRYLQAALNALTEQGLPSRNYQIHYPMLIDKATLRRAVALMRRPMVMGSIYGNLVNGPTVEVTKDFRANNDADFRRLVDGPFMSLSPAVRARIPELVKLLDRTFATPSPWERQAAAPVAALAVAVAS